MTAKRAEVKERMKVAATFPVEIEQAPATWRFRGQPDLHRAVRGMKHRGHSLRHCLRSLVEANDHLQLTPLRTDDLIEEIRAAWMTTERGSEL